MARFFSKRADALGKRPGEMVYIGRKPAKETQIGIITYDGKDLTEKNRLIAAELSSKLDEKKSWINIEGISDKSSMETVRDLFKISPLIAADIMHTGTRPKANTFDSGIYVTMKMLMYEKERNIILSEHLSLIISGNYLISFQEAEGDVFGPVRERLNDSKARIRNSGVDYLAYSLMDSVTDNYIAILQNLAEKIEDVEEELLDSPDEDVLKQIIYLKKELLFLSKSIRPAKEAVKQLITDKPAQIAGSMEFYSDLYSNLTHVVETIDLYKEIAIEQQNTYNAYVNNRLNEIMKFLTVFSVIFLPLTLITGIYGTNFDFIPELHFRYGYPMLWGTLVLFAGILIIIFKRKKWF